MEGFTAPSARHTPDLEHVAKISIGVECEVEYYGPCAIALHQQRFVSPLPQQPTPEQVNLAVGDQPAAPILKKGIGEMRGEHNIVAADIAAQKLRHLALHAQDQPGQDARIILE